MGFYPVRVKNRIGKIRVFSYVKSISYKHPKSCSQSHENGNRPQIADSAIPRYLAHKVTHPQAKCFQTL